MAVINGRELPENLDFSEEKQAADVREKMNIVIEYNKFVFESVFKE